MSELACPDKSRGDLVHLTPHYATIFAKASVVEEGFGGQAGPSPKRRLVQNLFLNKLGNKGSGVM